MTASRDAEFGVVFSDAQYFSVWLTHRKLPFGWHFTGPTGTQAEMQALVEQQFVPIRTTRSRTGGATSVNATPVGG
jgi:uncharacterized protein YbdZ (MbtH family)